MGQSTDGILFYGVELGEPYEVKTASNEDWIFDHWAWSNRYAERKGIVQQEGESREDFYDRKTKTIEASGCEVGTHCSGDCPMLYVSVKEFIARQGDPDKLNAKDFVPLPDAEEKLRAFFEVMGLVFDPADVSWYLVSYWG